jgi:hypothetical protein
MKKAASWILKLNESMSELYKSIVTPESILGCLLNGSTNAKKSEGIKEYK